MRIFFVGAALILSGCGSNRELGNAFASAVDAFSGGVDTELQLVVDLQKDFRRKSEQLEFLSNDSYTCGDPTDPYVRDITRRGKKGEIKVKKDARKKALEKSEFATAIVGYGEAIASINKNAEAFDKALDQMTAGAKAFSALAATPEATAFKDAALGVLGIMKAINDSTVEIRIRDAAIRMQPALKENVEQLKKQRNLSLFTAQEEMAFQFWNACARERLFFIRDFYPPALGTPKKGKYAGIAPTPVLDFAAAYVDYIAEREKFLARRADFATLLDAIIDANQKIIDKVDVLDSINNIGTTAGTLKQQGETVRKGFGGS